MNSYGNIDVNSIENKAYMTVDTNNTNELLERLNKEDILFYARYDDKKVQLLFERSSLDRINSVVNEMIPQSEKSPEKAPETVQEQEVKQQTVIVPAERDKLLPVLEAMTQHQEKKAENLKEKISTKQNKISKNQEKVTALTEKSARLRQNNAILRTMSKSSASPAIRHFIERKIDKNESRIAKIENEKIPGRKEKIAEHTKSVDKLQSKLKRSYRKIRHNTHLSNLISSFGVINRAERHERFMNALVGLNADAIDRTAAKANKCSVKIEKLTELYNQTNIAAEKFSINEKLQQLKAKKLSLSAKADRLHDAHGSYLDILNNKNMVTSEELIKNSEKAINTALNSENNSISKMIDYVCMNNADYMLDSILHSSEIDIEQNYNMVDGVINNLPPDTDEQLRKADIPPEHSELTDENDTVIPLIAETLDMSVSQVESLPDELREIAIVAYMNNSDMPKEELKDILASALELTPQASDIHTEPVRKEKTEIKEDTVIFSRASQKEYAAVASEKPASQNTEKIRTNDRHAEI